MADSNGDGSDAPDTAALPEEYIRTGPAADTHRDDDNAPTAAGESIPRSVDPNEPGPQRGGPLDADLAERVGDLNTEIDTDGTVTLDLLDRVRELLDEELPDLRDEKEHVETVLWALEEGETDEDGTVEGYAPSDRPGLEERRERLRAEVQKKEYLASLYYRKSEEWGGSEWVVRRNLGFHELEAIGDEIRSMSLASGKSREEVEALEGASKLKTLDYGVVQTPPEAPAFNDDDFPWQIGQWLYDRFFAINEYGDMGVNPGNS